MSEKKEQEQERKSLSRRNFLKNAGILAGGTVLGTTFLAGCAADATTPAAKSSEQWDYETDVAVVGFGGAGGAAAWEAGTAGSEVLIIEVVKVAGGSTDICGGLVTLGGGNALQKAAGIEDSVDNYYNYLVAAVGPGGDKEQLRFYAEKDLELYSWLTEKIGVKFNPGVDNLWPDPVNPTAGLTCTEDNQHNDYAGIATPTFRTGTVESEKHQGIHDGSGFFQPLLRAVTAIPNVKVMYETEGRELIFDQEKQRVIGIKAKQADKIIKIKARKAVILTAGGFASNEAMVQIHCPHFAGMPALGNGQDKGTGIEMAQAIGAAVKNMEFGLPLFDRMDLYTQNNTAGGPLSQGILVSQFGTRFIAEDHYHAWIANYITQNPRPDKYNPCYAIIDAKIYASIPEANKKAVESKIAAQANGIEELAKTLATPEGVLENTVSFYNAAVAKGKDTLFNKRTKFLKPITTAPFYAIKVSKSLFVSTGGLRINNDAQVIAAATEAPIAGLYSAGRNASNVSAQQYGGSGTSVASAFVFGRVAGQKAAAETAWG